ncbi:hypothetical protein ACIHAX_32340 [Nocardia sp. NPDC051929]|uniref:hypothetical protein n=1 Tax=unclassified Nocardia TaxID=2637762 RepID=UPI003437455A
MGENGVEWAKFVQSELDHEYARRNAADARAAATVTGSTGLATVVLAVIVILKGKDYAPSGVAAVALIFALLSLLSAALLGVCAGWSRRIRVTEIEMLRKLSKKKNWERNEEYNRRDIVSWNADTIDSLRSGTCKKYRLLFFSAVAQLCAVVALAIFSIVAMR